MWVRAPLVIDAGQERRPVVGIGASAGGIEAFRGFFENMPPDSGLGFIVVLIVEAADGCLVCSKPFKAEELASLLRDLRRKTRNAAPQHP